MNKKHLLFCLILFLFGVLSRLTFIEKMQSHMDGPMYSIALVNYSFEQDTPTPPGYPLYITAGKVLMLFTNDPHLALLYLSVLISGIGAVVYYLFGKSLYNNTSGLIASFLFLSSPSIYFFGITTYGYLFVLVMTTIIAWSVFEIVIKKKKNGISLGVIYAISLGVRPQELLTTLPLFLLGIYFLSKIERKKVILSFLCTLSAWFVPFILLTGGLHHYINVSFPTAKSSIPGFSFTYFLNKKFELISGLYLTLGVGGLVTFYIFIKYHVDLIRKKKLFSIKEKKIYFFSIVWVLPPLFFNIFIRTEHAGYQFGYLSFLIFLIAIYISKEYRKRQILQFLFLLILVTSNLIIFFYNRDPLYQKTYRQSSLHYSDIQRNDYELSKKVLFVKSNFNSKNTVAIVSSPFWRQYMYHLKEYRVYSFDAIFSRDKKYRNLIRVGYDWKRYSITNQSHIYTVPYNIHQIIFLEDEVCTWINTPGVKKYTFKKNICVLILPVTPLKKYIFDFHVFKLIK